MVCWNPALIQAEAWGGCPSVLPGKAPQDSQEPREQGKHEELQQGKHEELQPNKKGVASVTEIKLTLDILLTSAE